MYHRTMREFLNHILDALFPKKESTKKIEYLAINQGLRALTKAPDTPHSFIRALFHYKDSAVRTLVWEIKYGANTILIQEVAELISEEILSYFEDHSGFISREWILIPIPASKNHLHTKGFNQTDELAKAIMKTGANESLTYIPKVLYKIKETKPQVSIKNKAKRLVNLKDCFAVSNERSIVGKNVIIIDDVTTTGSTLIEAKRALKQAGAKQIIAFVVAH